MLEIMLYFIELIAHFADQFGVLAFGFLSVVVLLLYLQEYKKRRRELTESSFNSSSKDTQEKSSSILRKAYKQAQAILGKAELESVKVIADSRVAAKNLEEKYEEKLAKATDQIGAEITSELDKAQHDYNTFLTDLKTQAQQTQLLNQEFTKQKTNELFERFEQNLAQFLTSTEQKSVMAIELEMRAAKQLIDTYKQQQLTLIDENIIAMLEKTLSVVLAKKLTLKDQLDLVYEALEKAKVEKLIA